MIECTGTGWANAEWRSYTFVDPDGGDAEASIRETDVSWHRRRGSTMRLSKTEQHQAYTVVIESMKTTWLQRNINHLS